MRGRTHSPCHFYPTEKQELVGDVDMAGPSGMSPGDKEGWGPGHTLGLKGQSEPAGVSQSSARNSGSDKELLSR